jgi:hypothetical protein
MKATLIVLSLTALSATACNSDKPAQGPAEHAGEKVDQASEDAKAAARKAGDKIDEATDKAGKKYKEETTSDSGAEDDRIK